MNARLLFATDRMHVPDDHSGSVQTTHSLLQGLRHRGHACSTIATLRDGWRYHLATLVYRATLRHTIMEWEDSLAGYPVCRGSEWRFAERVINAMHRHKSDILILDSFRQLRNLERAGVRPDCPIVLMVHDTHFVSMPRTLLWSEQLTCVANSPFTAGVLFEHFGFWAPVIPPLVDFSRYKTTPTSRGLITMISPTEKKGVDTILHVAAALPDLNFLLVEGWPMSATAWGELRGRIAELPNIELRRSSADMRTVYADTSILLVPSKEHLETFGRVVVEAQANGIPVIARDRGALPWVVGEGGLIIPESTSDDGWIREVAALMQSQDRRNQLAIAATRNAAREAFRPDTVLTAFTDILEQVRGRWGAGHEAPR